MVSSFLSILLFYIVQDVWGQTSNLCPQTRATRISPRDIREALATASDIRSSFQSAARKPVSQLEIPVARHRRFQLSKPLSKMLENTQERLEEASKVLRQKFKLKPEQIVFELAEIDLTSILSGNELDSCTSQFNVGPCRPKYKYRTLDGSCNNLRHPSWGMAGSCFERLVDPDYADGISERRFAKSGYHLPSSRRISLEIHNHFNNPSDHVTHMLMVWGQFLDHDMSMTMRSQVDHGCCPAKDGNPPACDPIILSRDDPFFGYFNITCLSNVHSASCSTCTLGPRQQINQQTGGIDASPVYGLSQNQSLPLRNNDGTGTFRSRNFPGVGELPHSSLSPNDDLCSFQDKKRGCFQTGDIRANSHPALTAIHILFLREHNRIARKLREMNPSWSEETLFQEARRIVVAEIQLIAYKEFLPLVVGPERMEQYDLNVRRNGQFTDYDETLSAALFNEFSAVAFRFGHSMINGFFPNLNQRNQGYYLKDTFNFPFPLYSKGYLEGIVGGLAMSPSQNFDRYMVRDVTNHLYQRRGGKTGLDLASLDIQRGRDHGIPGYPRLVEFCGGPKIRKWRDLDRVFHKGLRKRFQRIYERVEDIDPFSAGLAEKHIQGGVVGPTFACIIARQFHRLKYGDRFYFEHGGQAGSFTKSQLTELRKVSFSKIICDNSKIDRLTRNVFLRPRSGNRIEPCNEKEEMNLEAWRVHK